MNAIDRPAPSKPGTEGLLPTFPDFELHYDFDSRHSVIHVLDSIVKDLSTYSSVHTWDEKLINDNVKDLAKFSNQELNRWEFYNASYVLTYSAVKEVYILNGINRRHHAPERYLPEINVGPSTRWRAPWPDCHHLQEIKRRSKVFNIQATPRHPDLPLAGLCTSSPRMADRHNE